LKRKISVATSLLHHKPEDRKGERRISRTKKCTFHELVDSQRAGAAALPAGGKANVKQERNN
jgi:hypothetical protein